MYIYIVALVVSFFNAVIITDCRKKVFLRQSKKKIMFSVWGFFLNKGGSGPLFLANLLQLFFFE